MALKTFNVEKEVYDEFSQFCKENGLNMSRQIEIFMEFVIEEEPKAKKKYLEKLQKIRKGTFIPVKSLTGRYGS